MFQRRLGVSSVPAVPPWVSEWGRERGVRVKERPQPRTMKGPRATRQERIPGPLVQADAPGGLFSCKST